MHFWWVPTAYVFLIFVCVEVFVGVDVFICVEVFICIKVTNYKVLWHSQPNEVMSSAVSLPNHTFTGQA